VPTDEKDRIFDSLDRYNGAAGMLWYGLPPQLPVCFFRRTERYYAFPAYEDPRSLRQNQDIRNYYHIDYHFNVVLAL
jgi:hypothetical protein